MKPSSVFLPVAALAATMLAAPSAASAKSPARPHDFNGDGRTDLVVNAYQSVKRGEVGPGVVAVLYGGTYRKQVITRDSRGVAAVADHGDHFGESTASADFDRDGYADLAVTGRNDDGVTVVYGSKKGLSGRAAFLKTAQPSGLWQDRLAVADFDGDGRTDLVATAGGRYWIFSGVGRGRKVPVSTGDLRVSHLLPVAGDFTGDGRTDLVLGSSAEDAAFFLRNSATGLAAPVPVPGLASVHAAASGDFNGDGRDDLVTATWDSVRIQLGGPSGPGKPRSVTGEAGGAPITGSGTNAPAVGDIDRDGRDDLVIGSPYAGPGRSGRVVVLRGHKSGLTTRGARVLSQRNKALKADPERGDGFGWAVRLLDLSGDRRPELVVGSPGENRNDGRLYVLRNAGREITAKGVRKYGQKDFGLSGSRFGFLLLP